MQLNLPCFDDLRQCRNLLIAGMGGGFDVYCGLPLYFELRDAGCQVHLANLSFTNLRFIHDAIPLCEGCVGVTPESHSVLLYAPELHLAHHLGETVWCFYGGGVLPLLAAYRALVAHLEIDGIVLIDGGVDSLMRGDKSKMGTIMEDWQSLAAVNQLTDVPMRLLATLGYGAENDIDLAAVLANVAALTTEGAFRGACPLHTPNRPPYRNMGKQYSSPTPNAGRTPAPSMPLFSPLLREITATSTPPRKRAEPVCLSPH